MSGFTWCGVVGYAIAAVAVLVWLIGSRIGWWMGWRKQVFHWVRCIKHPVFAVSDRWSVLPRCECWRRRPRWMVIRRFFILWRCADCGRPGRLVRGGYRRESTPWAHDVGTVTITVTGLEVLQNEEPEQLRALIDARLAGARAHLIHLIEAKTGRKIDVG